MESRRWETARQRIRLLTGQWGIDVQRRVLSHFGTTRASIIGRAVRSLNLFARVCQGLASCYDDPPRVWHASGEVLAGFLADAAGGAAGLVERLGVWALMPDVQRYTIGVREELLRVDWNSRDGVHVRRAHADAVQSAAWNSTPEIPHTIWELRWYDDLQTWVWEITSIRDPRYPVFELRDAAQPGAGERVDVAHLRLLPGMTPSQLGRDITRQVYGQELSGSAYPYRWTQGVRRGQPFLPFVCYHAQKTGALWNGGDQQEAVEASLDVATAWTFFMHALFRAGWPQRWLAGGDIQAGGTEEAEDGARMREVVTDPTSVLHFLAHREGAPVQVGQWGPGANLMEMAEAIGRFEAAVSNFDGLDANHVVRRTSNDMESAASLAIQRDARRQAKAVYEEQQRRGDLDLLGKLAALHNLAGARPAPEDGYRIEYRGLPLSGAELTYRRQHNNEQIDRGRMSVVDAYMDENPGVTREEAKRELLRIRQENQEFGAAAAAA